MTRIRLSHTARREQIISSATTLLSTKGFKTLTIKEIADSCSLSKAGLLHYFPSKEHLLVAVLQERERNEMLVLAKSESVKLKGLDRIRHMLHEAVVLSCEHPELVKLFTILRVEALDTEHPAHEYFRSRERKLTADLSKALAKFSSDPESSALRLQSLLMGLEYQWLCADASFDLPGEWASSVDILLSGCDRE